MTKNERFIRDFTSREFIGFLMVSIIWMIMGFRIAFLRDLPDYFMHGFERISDIWLWAFGIYAGIRTVQKISAKKEGDL